MQNGTISSMGQYTAVTSSSPNPGNKKSPTAFSFDVLRVSLKPWEEFSYYGYSGEVLEYVSPRFPGLAGLHSSISDAGLPQAIFAQPDWALTRDRAMESIYDQLRGKSEIIIDLAESREAKRMIRKSLELKSFCLDFARRFIKKKGSRLDWIQDKWLEYRYGWSPLVHSIYDAADNLNRRVQNEPWFVKGKGSSTSTNNKHYSFPNNGRRSYSETLRWRTEVGVIISPPPPSVQAAANWTSLNPLSIAWELLPYSFVADWFVNVGDTIRQYENYAIYASGFQGGYMSNSTRVDRTSHFSYDGVLPPEYNSDGSLVRKFYGSRGAQSARTEIRTLNRVVLSSLPLPGGIKVRANLNAKRLLDAAFLVRARFK